MSAKKETYFFRPIIDADAPALLKLIRQSSGGLSSLQPRLAFLKDYIASSEKSFSGNMSLDDSHKYLLGLFELRSERLIGCAAVKTQIGKDSPFINFDIKGDGPDQCLQASSRFTGATEVGSLFLHPDYRADGLGRYLAKVRYLLMASEPWRFGESVIGCIDMADMPIAVRASLGQPHPSGIGAMRLLQSEGFVFSGTIDLFDAGPIMSVL